MYTQVFNPLHNVALSAIVALLPIIFFFVALVIFKMKAWLAGFITTVIAIVLGYFVYGMPISLGILSGIHGAAYGIFPIGWIVFMAVFLYNMTLETGQFDTIKQSISSITDDRRLQVLLIAFGFGAFLEGAAGFGTPVAITAAILIGLGFEKKHAACMCLLANTAPVAFGGLGIPVLVAAQVTNLDPMVASKQLATVIPLLGIFVPFYLVAVMSGIKGMLEVWPAIVVTALGFSVPMFLSSYFLGPILPDILAALGTMIGLTLFLRVWKPKKVWRFSDDAPIQSTGNKLSLKEVVYAWSPFIVLIIFIGNWGIDAVKGMLDVVTFSIPIPGLNEMIMNNNVALKAIFKVNWLSAAGTGIFFATIVSALIARMSVGRYFALMGKTFQSLKWSLLTIACVLAYAFVGNNTGMTTTLGNTVAESGSLFPLFACVVGWLGVFVTGSDTSANALFGKLQTTAFQEIGSVPVLGIGANLAGGGVGKMISPQSIAIAAAATGLEGREGELYKFSLRHSIVLLILVCIWIFVLNWGATSHNVLDLLVTHTVGDASLAHVKHVVDWSVGSLVLGISLVVMFVLGIWCSKKQA